MKIYRYPHRRDARTPIIDELAQEPVAVSGLPAVLQDPHALAPVFAYVHNVNMIPMKYACRIDKKEPG